jgi:hypothetical protein
MRDKSDLGVAGKPLETWINRPDGSRSLYPVPQTKWDNCAHLRRELQGRHPTDDELASWELTRREYELFLDGQPERAGQARQRTRDHFDVDRDGKG